MERRGDKYVYEDTKEHCSFPTLQLSCKPCQVIEPAFLANREKGDTELGTRTGTITMPNMCKGIRNVYYKY